MSDNLNSRTKDDAEADGHGSFFNPGDKHGRWVLDKDLWWKRLANAKDTGLVDRNYHHGLISDGYVYVRSKKIADRLDKGLTLRN